MNERLVEFVAQTISAMSDEDRQLLEIKLGGASVSQPFERFQSTAPSRTISSVDRTYSKSQVLVHSGRRVVTKDADKSEGTTSQQTAKTEKAASESTNEDRNLSPHQEALKSFFAQIKSIQVEGPKDWSSRIDDYMYEDTMSEHG